MLLGNVTYQSCKLGWLMELRGARSMVAAMMGQIHDLGPRGRAQGSSWLVPAMMVQSCYLGCREWG